MIIPRILVWIMFRNRAERRAALQRFLAKRKARALNTVNVHHWIHVGTAALGGSTTHRTSTSGGYNGRTGNPSTGNRRPGMRRTKGGEI